MYSRQRRASILHYKYIIRSIGSQVEDQTRMLSVGDFRSVAVVLARTAYLGQSKHNNESILIKEFKNTENKVQCCVTT